jgi:hypothetical protein
MSNYLRQSNNISRWVSIFLSLFFLYNLVCRPEPAPFILR